MAGTVAASPRCLLAESRAALARAGFADTPHAPRSNRESASVRLRGHYARGRCWTRRRRTLNVVGSNASPEHNKLRSRGATGMGEAARATTAERSLMRERKAVWSQTGARVRLGQQRVWLVGAVRLVCVVDGQWHGWDAGCPALGSLGDAKPGWEGRMCLPLTTGSTTFV